MSKKFIAYSAPGKIILSGEHTVLYGKCALISAIDRRLTFTISEGYQKKDNNVDFIGDIVKKYLEENSFSIQKKHYHINVKSLIPRNRGMGSSGAFAVAGVAAFLEFFSGKKDFELEVINNLAFQVEKRFHGKPSGVDQTTSCFGGLVFFRKEFEFLKGIYKLNFKIPKNIGDSLFLVDSGRPKENTAAMVKLVGDLYNSKTKQAQDIMNELEKVTKRVVVSIMKEDMKFFDENIDKAGDLLDELGIVSTQTRKIVKGIRQFGSCKVTGAGGIQTNSGFLLCSIRNVPEFKKYCEGQGLKVLKFIPSQDGLKRL